MAKVGDTVRYLNSVGGGKIVKIEGQLAYVEEDGFETPVLLKELVVVMPAGHDTGKNGPKMMFDQKAFDEGRREIPAEEPKHKEPVSLPEPDLPIEETDHGEKLNIVLAFEPSDVKNLGKSTFNAVLVNDSNYFITFAFMRRSTEERGWTLVYQGTVLPNELIDLASYTHENLGEIERVAVQAFAYKRDKTFTMKLPVNVSRRLDLTKFHKLHCFRPGMYFESPVLEFPIINDDTPVKQLEVDAKAIEASMGGKMEKDPVAELSKKYRVDAGRDKKKKTAPEANPHKLLPPIEVDLHIAELTDSIAGMKNSDMLNMQLDEVRKVMKANSKRIGQKIVFIHGKGEGVLRNAVLALLRKEFPKAELQDASFREYGFGATLVTVH